MITKQDLRLGNIFEQGIVCKINGRTGAKVHVYGKLRYKNGLKVIESVAVEDLKPIPLSTQVLVDWCGAVPCRERGFYLIGGNNQIEITAEGFVRVYDYTGDHIELKREIKSLHELQNIFYLLNQKELEIKE